MRLTVLLTVVLAFILAAASQASASVLCDQNESGCPAESTYEAGESFTFSLSSMSFTFWETVTCGTGEMKGKLTAAGGEENAVEAEITDLKFTECFRGATVCFASAKNLPYDASFEGSGGNGTLVLTDPVSVRIGVECLAQGMLQFCTGKTASIEFEFTGGVPAVATATNSPLERDHAFCPGSSGTFSASYESAEVPFPSMFIVDGPAPSSARLCQVNVSPCVISLRYATGTPLEASLEGNSIFEFLYEGKKREPACEGGSLAGKTTAAGKPLIGEVSALSFSKCGGGVCTVEAQALPFKAEIENTTGGNGTLALANGGGGTAKIEVNCGKAFKCIYKASGASFAFTGSSTAPKLAVAQTLEKDASSEAECGSTMTWTAAYKLTKPTPLFVTS